MSDDEDNVVQFGKVLNESKSNNAVSVEERVVNCMSNDKCECLYCNYRKNAATMMIDMLSRDVINFEKNSGTKFCTFDLKDIFFKAIMEIKKLEKEPNGEEDSE